MATRLPTGYDHRREALATYFDSTARQAWIDLTSDTKVSGIRATVRAGRDNMRNVLLSWLPDDLRRTRLLDAGCGTGAFSIAAACRGAEVTGIDVAAGLVEVARERTPSFIGHGRIHWHAGDMLDPDLGTFAHVVAMDSLIHYQPEELVAALTELAQRTTRSILFHLRPAHAAAGDDAPGRQGVPQVRPLAGHRADRRKRPAPASRRAARLDHRPHTAHFERVLHLAGA